MECICCFFSSLFLFSDSQNLIYVRILTILRISTNATLRPAQIRLSVPLNMIQVKVLTWDIQNKVMP